MSVRTKESYDYMMKVIVIGDTGVGKTNIIINFAENKFKETYVATIGVDFKTKIIQLDDKKAKLQIWDTAGQERFRTITETYYKGAAGIILTYAINSKASFVSLEKWIQQISEKTPPGIKKVIIGNKNDLNDQREVTQKEGTDLAKRYSTEDNKIDFFQVSAKTGENICDVFMLMGHLIKKEMEKDQNHSPKPIVRIATKDHNAVPVAQQRKNCNC